MQSVYDFIVSLNPAQINEIGIPMPDVTVDFYDGKTNKRMAGWFSFSSNLIGHKWDDVLKKSIITKTHNGENPRHIALWVVDNNTGKRNFADFVEALKNGDFDWGEFRGHKTTPRKSIEQLENSVRNMW